MKTLNQNIHPATLLPIGAITETTAGATVDTYLSDRPAYDSGLTDIAIGDLGDQTSTKVKIEESDASDFSSGVSVANGGEEITASADTGYKIQIERKKRYLRAVITITAGSAPSAEASAANQPNEAQMWDKVDSLFTVARNTFFQGNSTFLEVLESLIATLQDMKENEVRPLGGLGTPCVDSGKRSKILRMGLLIIGKRINAHMFFKRLELKEKIWCDIVAQAKVVRANYGHPLTILVR